MKKYLVGVDIGGTNIRVSLVNEEGFLIKIQQKTQLEGNLHTIPKQVLALIQEACKILKIDLKEIIALGIGAPGQFKKKRGNFSLLAPNLCGALAPERKIIPNNWQEIPLEKDLCYHFPSLKIKNDCVVSAQAECLFGAGKGKKNFVYVTISTGIGGGIFSDGAILKGKNNNAGHLGHISLSKENTACSCGGFGHLESLCSGNALARDYKSKTSEEVFQAYLEKDNNAITIIDKMAMNLGRGLSSVNAILDTELFILGGSVFLHNTDILLPKIKKEFYQAFPLLAEETMIVPTPLGHYLGDLGALSLVMPTNWVELWKNQKPWQSAPKTVKIN